MGAKIILADKTWPKLLAHIGSHLKINPDLKAGCLLGLLN
jgi:hypothetical protein